MDHPRPWGVCTFRQTRSRLSPRQTCGCLYVALAEREGRELITGDTRLVNRLLPTYPYIRSVDSLL
jgi:hypothetical protein